MKKFAYRIEGLTLIEVLIALAIIGIALTAIIKAVSQSIRATTYLQEKTIALWVGEQVLNEARVGILSLDESDQTKHKIMMLTKNWYWQANQISTPNLHIKKIEVKVFTNVDEDAKPLISLESYVYQKNTATSEVTAKGA
jgi:general secretion pathway protein I